MLRGQPNEHVDPEHVLVGPEALGNTQNERPVHPLRDVPVGVPGHGGAVAVVEAVAPAVEAPDFVRVGEPQAPPDHKKAELHRRDILVVDRRKELLDHEARPHVPQRPRLSVLALVVRGLVQLLGEAVHQVSNLEVPVVRELHPSLAEARGAALRVVLDEPDALRHRHVRGLRCVVRLLRKEPHDLQPLVLLVPRVRELVGVVEDERAWLSEALGRQPPLPRHLVDIEGQARPLQHAAVSDEVPPSLVALDQVRDVKVFEQLEGLRAPSALCRLPSARVPAEPKGEVHSGHLEV
mmetsp:Transcript_29539/g.93188  ORF Transcript_29539/g.93188 Transcript_29539/m.93188 type:complete len:294 (-) Transcript_29539:217-1098(-)